MPSTRTPLRLVALAAVLGLVAVACAGDGDDTAADDVDAERCPVDALDDADGPVRVNYWHAMPGPNGEAVEALADEYNDSQDRVQVNPVFQGQTYDEVADKFLAALRGGELPHLLQLEETRVQMGIDSQAMLPAQACVDAAGYDLSDHLDAVIDQYTVEGVLWPVPFQTSNPVLYYNATAFEEAGIGEDEVPTTLEELRDVSQRLVDAGVVPHGIALELRPWVLEELYAKADESLVNNDNGRSGRATEVNLDSDFAVELFTYVDEMIDSGLALSVGRNEGGIDQFLAVANRNAAMTIGTTAALGGVLQVLGSGDVEGVTRGVGPLPGPDGGGVGVGGGANWIIERGASDAEKAAAWEFASWLNEPEQQATWHEATGYIPIRRSAVELAAVEDLWSETPEYRVAFDQLMASERSYGGPVIGDYAEMREALIEALERIVLQDADPADALAEAKERADLAIQDYNSRVDG